MRTSRILLAAALALPSVDNPLLVRRHYLWHADSFRMARFLRVERHFIILRVRNSLNVLLWHLVLLHEHRSGTLLLHHVHLVLGGSHYTLVNGQVIHRRADALLILIKDSLRIGLDKFIISVYDLPGTSHYSIL